jgi:hypothetical protein
MKYQIKIRCTVTVDCEAASTAEALAHAQLVMATEMSQENEPSILSIVREGVLVEAVEYNPKDPPPTPRPPGGRPNGGGSPGTPRVVQLINTEAVAAARAA